MMKWRLSDSIVKLKTLLQPASHIVAIHFRTVNLYITNWKSKYGKESYT